MTRTTCIVLFGIHRTDVILAYAVQPVLLRRRCQVESYQVLQQTALDYRANSHSILFTTIVRGIDRLQATPKCPSSIANEGTFSVTRLCAIA